MPVLDSYRRVLSRPGALRFSSAGVVARLPIAMVTLGVVLLVEGETGSYGLAGAVSAASTCSAGGTSPTAMRADAVCKPSTCASRCAP